MVISTSVRKMISWKEYRKAFLDGLEDWYDLFPGKVFRLHFRPYTLNTNVLVVIAYTPRDSPKTFKCANTELNDIGSNPLTSAYNSYNQKRKDSAWKALTLLTPNNRKSLIIVITPKDLEKVSSP